MAVSIDEKKYKIRFKGAMWGLRDPFLEFWNPSYICVLPTV